MTSEVPSPIRRRPRVGVLADAVCFPIRALFMGPKGYLGLSSLREERMRTVAEFCRGGVLDIGCGPHNLFIRDFIGTANGTGVDVFAYEGVPQVVDDATLLPFAESSFDTVTLIAVGGHIPKSKRAAEFHEIARVLKPGGRLVMTEGEPITQWLAHTWWHFYLGLQGKTDIDHERGMEEDEQYCMPRNELNGYLNTAPFRLVHRRPFMWRLNTVYVAECSK
jgi:SAM-dependent methyltransferase